LEEHRNLIEFLDCF